LDIINLSNGRSLGVYLDMDGIEIHEVKVSKMSKYVVTFSIVMSHNGGQKYDRTYNVGVPGVRCLMKIVDEGEYVMIDERRPDRDYLSFVGGCFDRFFETYGQEDFELAQKEAMKIEVMEECGLEVELERLRLMGEFNPMPAYFSAVVYGFYMEVEKHEFDGMNVFSNESTEIIKSINRYTKNDLKKKLRKGDVCGEALALFGLYDLSCDS
jgi:8-oxo-dGTP pyrophosphatase MutT (NUDIX family)